MGGFLIVLTGLHFAGRPIRLSRVRPWVFASASFATAVLSALVGASGPTMNPVYVASGIVEQRMIGTKAASSLAMQVAKLASYLALGLAGPEVWKAGLVVGAGTLVGNVLGKRALGRISAESFTHAVYAFVGLSGLGIAWRSIFGG